MSRSVFGELQVTQMSLNFKTSCCKLKIRGLGAKLYEVIALFWFWKELWCFKVEDSMPNKKVNFNKTKRNKNWLITHPLIERWTLRFNSYKNCELKIKPWWVGAREKKSAYFLQHLFQTKETFAVVLFYLNV